MGDPKDIRMVHFYSGNCRSIYGNDNFFQVDVLAYDPLELKMML